MNNWNKSITLVTQTQTRDSNGILVNGETLLTGVPAEFKSVSRQEAVTANQLGYMANYVIRLLKVNYSGQQMMIDEDNSKRYRVQRQFEVTPEIIELTVSDNG